LKSRKNRKNVIEQQLKKVSDIDIEKVGLYQNFNRLKSAMSSFRSHKTGEQSQNLNRVQKDKYGSSSQLRGSNPYTTPIDGQGLGTSGPGKTRQQMVSYRTDKSSQHQSKNHKTGKMSFRSVTSYISNRSQKTNRSKRSKQLSRK
jgi:hypothetical protein